MGVELFRLEPHGRKALLCLLLNLRHDDLSQPLEPHSDRVPYIPDIL